MLNGASGATRSTCEKPASRKTWRIAASPPIAPSACGPCCDTPLGVHRNVETAYIIPAIGLARFAASVSSDAGSSATTTPSASESSAGVAGRGDGIAQVVQAVDEQHDVVAVAREARGVGDLEGQRDRRHPPARGVARPRDRVIVEVEADETRRRESLGEQHRRAAIATTDVGHRDARLEALEQPGTGASHTSTSSACCSGRLNRSCTSHNSGSWSCHAMPSPVRNACSSAGSMRHTDAMPWNAADQERRAVLVREHHRRLGGERERRGRVVVDEEAVGGLGREPFAQVTLVEAGSAGEFGRGQRPGAGHRLPQAELVAERDQGRVERGGRLAAAKPTKASSAAGSMAASWSVSVVVMGRPSARELPTKGARSGVARREIWTRADPRWTMDG